MTNLIENQADRYVVEVNNKYFCTNPTVSKT